MYNKRVVNTLILLGRVGWNLFRYDLKDIGLCPSKKEV